MSAAAVYNLHNMSSSQYGSPAERGALLNSLRTSPRTASLANQQLLQQHQQQMQMAHMQAMYQQQQYELAQQQAALELQLQLEQFRLQNLALQEQIMLGQVAQAQAQAEAEAVLQHRLSERNIYTAPQKFTALGSRGFVATQGGVLAERAFTRRTQHQDQQQQPQISSGHHRRKSSTGSYLSSTSPYDPHAPTPALILSKPGEAFPVSSPVATHKHSDSEGSSVSSAWSSLEAFMHSEGQGSEDNAVDSPPSEVASFASGGSAKQSPPPLATGGAWEATVTAASVAAASEIVTPKAKLNPFSSVFVPASKAQQKASAAALAPVVVTAPTPVAPQAGVYRAPRSGSPPTSGNCPLGRFAPRASPPGGTTISAIPTRQPKGPPSHAEELDAQNFNSRLRKRAMNTIRNMNLAPRSPTSPSTVLLGSTFEYQQQQQQQILPGLVTLMQATKAREERVWKGGDVLF